MSALSRAAAASTDAAYSDDELDMCAMADHAAMELEKFHLPHDLADNDVVTDDFTQLAVVFAEMHLTTQDDAARKSTSTRR